jgi:hypothetical protein
MEKIVITGYLTEEKLGQILSAPLRITDIKSQFILPGSRFRVDYFCHINGEPTCIEYDGHLHYTDFKVICRDREVEHICSLLGFKLIRIPYFVQLTNSTLRYFFGNIDLSISQNYAHGFIDSSIFPSYFHLLGYVRYVKEINIFKTINENNMEVEGYEDEQPTVASIINDSFQLGDRPEILPIYKMHFDCIIEMEKELLLSILTK